MLKRSFGPAPSEMQFAEKCKTPTNQHIYLTDLRVAAVSEIRIGQSSGNCHVPNQWPIPLPWNQSEATRTSAVTPTQTGWLFQSWNLKNIYKVSYAVRKENVEGTLYQRRTNDNEAPCPLPEFTARVHGPSTRVVETGLQYYRRYRKLAYKNVTYKRARWHVCKSKSQHVCCSSHLTPSVSTIRVNGRLSE